MKLSMRLRLGFALLFVLVWGPVWLGCDSSNPVAPASVDGLAPANQYTITLTASSTTVFAGAASPVTFTVTVVDNRDGSPAADGLTLSVSTSLGNFGVDASNTPITLLTLALTGGRVSFDFFAGDEPGVAELLARLADSVGSFSVTVADPGEAPEAAFSFEANGLEVLFRDASSGTPTGWAWRFGDGGRSYEQNPKHTFARDDVYEVKLTVTDALGRTSAASDFVEVASSLVAAFEATPGAGLTVLFKDASEGNPDSFAWDFGDGSGSSEQNPSHTYGAPGEYLVTLTVGKRAASANAAQFVEVGAAIEQPVADWSFESNDLTVLFTDASSGEPTSWLWDFGDGETSNAQNPSHTYTAADTYEVRLTVANARGSSDLAKFVTVPNDELVADFDFSPSGLVVTFQDKSTGAPAAWSWDFGDGASSAAQNPVHVYAAAATYEVKLTVSNAQGASSVTKQVTVP